MNKRIVLGAVLAALFAALLAAGIKTIISAPSASASTVTTVTLHPWDQSHQPCRGEDGPGPCFWNADSRGDQKGIDVHFDRRGRDYVPFRDITDANGKRHDACWIHVANTARLWCEDGFRATS